MEGGPSGQLIRHREYLKFNNLEGASHVFSITL